MTTEAPSQPEKADSELLQSTNYSGFRLESTWKPVVMVRGDGVFIEDEQGKRYIDISAQPAAVNLGHNNRHIIDAIKEQADKLAYVGVGFGTDTRARFSRRSKRPNSISRSARRKPRYSRPRPR